MIRLKLFCISILKERDDRVRNRRQQYKQNRYLLRQAKEAVHQAKRFALLASDERTIRSDRTLQFRTTPQQLLAVLLFSTLIIPVGGVTPDKKEKKTIRSEPKNGCVNNGTQTCQADRVEPLLQIKSAPGVRDENCFYVKEKINGIKSALPDSVAMFDRVIEQKKFSVTCVKPTFFSVKKTYATYKPDRDTILYPASPGPLERRTLHHEFIHADTTLTCRVF